MGAKLSILFLYPILVSDVLGDSPSIQEILWNFCCIKDKMKRLTLKENPHFYVKLPTLLKEHGDGVDISPTEDFRHADEYFVLTDKQELVHIMTGNKILHSFGNLWRSENGIILKGSSIFFFVFPVSDLLTDICGRLRGEGIIKASLRGTYGEFYVKRLPMSAGVPRAFRTLNNRGLQLIITALYPWTSWEHFIDRPPTNNNDSSVNFYSVYVFTKQVAPNSPVCSNVIAFNCIYSHCVAPGPFATNI